MVFLFKITYDTPNADQPLIPPSEHPRMSLDLKLFHVHHASSVGYLN